MQSTDVIRGLAKRPRLKWFVMASYETVMRSLMALPRYRTLNRLKAAFLRLNGARIGKRVVFYPGVWLAPGRNLVVGDDVDFALDVLVESSGGVEIGDRVLIGYRTQIFSSNHLVPAGPESIFGAGRIRKQVVIESDAWIGAGCIVLAGYGSVRGRSSARGAWLPMTCRKGRSSREILPR